MSTTHVDLTEPVAGILPAVELWLIRRPEAGWWVAVVPDAPWWIDVGPVVIGRVWGERSTWLAREGGARVGTVHDDQEAATRALVAAWAAGRAAVPDDRDRTEAGL